MTRDEIMAMSAEHLNHVILLEQGWELSRGQWFDPFGYSALEYPHYVSVLLAAWDLIDEMTTAIWRVNVQQDYDGHTVYATELGTTTDTKKTITVSSDILPLAISRVYLIWKVETK